MSQHKVTLNGTDAINVNNAQAGGNVASINLPTGVYSAELSTDVTFADHGYYPCHQAILYNSNGSQPDVSTSAYSILMTTYAVYPIYADSQSPIYVSLLDQISSADNKGKLTVIFKKVS